MNAALIPENEMKRFESSALNITIEGNNYDVRVEFLNLLYGIQVGKIKNHLDLARELKRINSLYTFYEAVAGKERRGEEELQWRSMSLLSNLRVFLNPAFQHKDVEEKVKHIASFYYTAIRPPYLFFRGNNSEFMNMANGMLRLCGLKGILHKDLDEKAKNMQRSEFQELFLNEVFEANLEIWDHPKFADQAMIGENANMESRRSFIRKATLAVVAALTVPAVITAVNRYSSMVNSFDTQFSLARSTGDIKAIQNIQGLLNDLIKQFKGDSPGITSPRFQSNLEKINAIAKKYDYMVFVHSRNGIVLDIKNSESNPQIFNAKIATSSEGIKHRGTVLTMAFNSDFQAWFVPLSDTEGKMALFPLSERMIDIIPAFIEELMKENVPEDTIKYFGGALEGLNEVFIASEKLTENKPADLKKAKKKILMQYLSYRVNQILMPRNYFLGEMRMMSIKGKSQGVLLLDPLDKERTDLSLGFTTYAGQACLNIFSIHDAFNGIGEKERNWHGMLKGIAVKGLSDDHLLQIYAKHELTHQERIHAVAKRLFGESIDLNNLSLDQFSRIYFELNKVFELDEILARLGEIVSANKEGRLKDVWLSLYILTLAPDSAINNEFMFALLSGNEAAQKAVKEFANDPENSNLLNIGVDAKKNDQKWDSILNAQRNGDSQLELIVKRASDAHQILIKAWDKRVEGIKRIRSSAQLADQAMKAEEAEFFNHLTPEQEAKLDSTILTNESGRTPITQPDGVAVENLDALWHSSFLLEHDVPPSFNRAKIALFGPGSNEAEVKEMIRRYPNISEFYVFDRSKVMLAYIQDCIKKWAQNEGLMLPRMRYRVVDLTDMPQEYRTGNFDFVYERGVFDRVHFSDEHMDQVFQAVKEMLKPRGMYLSTGLYADQIDYLPPSAKQGFQIKRIPYNILPVSDVNVTLALVKDMAMKSKTEHNLPGVFNRGGIDLTPANMNIQVKTGSPTEVTAFGGIPSNGGTFGDDKVGIKFHLDPAMLQRLQSTPGFVPVIINIQPLINLKQFLGA